ncbi:MAG: hypothetical protein COY66_05990 [Candidatus Kerfeldbacteria bacterium CG_4_10_14_0_8_um_filter_42_10]|uniref:Transcriptional repressor n=1 Tax=Candidatus Kerfeldbacteria bacterium CG_4_10_14_0_8_um_filter_42_10 TaxID=2014248 RepID=A0A2M7RG54_9BACT|nr:MAG: hypothetical protein COY66_05990 [Candidatus Kerfeldbacteria bacterium CG_4_10_14_0_8_um_filter_42_10]
MILDKKKVEQNRKSTRLTAQKKTILASIRRFWPIHPTPQMVFRSVKKKIPNISLGTVYRNVNSLRVSGYIEEITIPDEPSRLDSRVDDHFHFRCEHCGEIADVENPKLIRLAKQTLKEKGYLAMRSNLMYSGLCQKCRKNKASVAIECCAHGKMKTELPRLKKNCQLCNFEEECSYHTIK